MKRIVVFTSAFFLISSFCFAIDLGEIGKTLEGAGVGDALKGAGIDLNRITDYLDWETINVSLSSDMTSVTETLGKKVAIDGKVFKKGLEGLRINLKSGLEVPGKKTMKLTDCYVLLHLMQKDAYLIFPLRKAYIKVDPDEVHDMLGNLKKKHDGKPKVEKKEELGMETVEGYSCKKMHVVTSLPSGTRTDTVAWLAQDLKGFPVKSVASFKTPQGITGTNTTSFTNIEKKEPEEELFSFPKDYTKYDNLVEVATEGKLGSRLDTVKKRAEKRKLSR